MVQGVFSRLPWLQVETVPHQKRFDRAVEQEPQRISKEVIGGGSEATLQ